MIRPPRQEDLSRLAEIHIAGWRYAYRGVVSDHELFVARTVEKGLVFWRRVVEETPERVLVYDDGIVRGFAFHWGCRDDDAPTAHEVGALYAEPAFVRTGVGSALIAAAEDVARGAGKVEMKLWVLEANATGRAFYEKNGYRPDGGVKIIEEWNGARELRYHKSLVLGSSQALSF